MTERCVTMVMVAADGVSVVLCAGLSLLPSQQQEVDDFLLIVPADNIKSSNFSPPSHGAHNRENHPLGVEESLGQSRSILEAAERSHTLEDISVNVCP